MNFINKLIKPSFITVLSMYSMVALGKSEVVSVKENIKGITLVQEDTIQTIASLGEPVANVIDRVQQRDVTSSKSAVQEGTVQDVASLGKSVANATDSASKKDVTPPEPSCKQPVNGRVFERGTENAIPNAEIRLFEGNYEILRTPINSDGTYFLEVDCDKNYEIVVKLHNYSPRRKPFTTPKILGEAIIVDIPLEAFEFEVILGRKTVKTKKVDFLLDNTKIEGKLRGELRKVAEILLKYPDIEIFIESHTDSRGPDSYNLTLTENRVQTIINYLTKAGVDSNRLSGKGFGETRPMNICTNDIPCTSSQHRENRRILFVVKDDEGGDEEGGENGEEENNK